MGTRSGAAKLVALAVAIGYKYVRESAGGGHFLLHHEGTPDVPGTGQLMTIPKNVSEAQWRTVANLGRDLLVNAGLSLRGREAEPGNRRARRHPTGESFEREETRRVRRADILRTMRYQAIERREREAIFYRRMMMP